MIQCWKCWLSSHGALLFLEEAFLGEERWGGGWEELWLGSVHERRIYFHLIKNRRLHLTQHSKAPVQKLDGSIQVRVMEKLRKWDLDLCMLYILNVKKASLSLPLLLPLILRKIVSHIQKLCVLRELLSVTTHYLSAFSAHFLATPEPPYTWFGIPWLKYHYHLVKYLICVQVILSGRCSTLPHLSRE